MTQDNVPVEQHLHLKPEDIRILANGLRDLSLSEEQRQSLFTLWACEVCSAVYETVRPPEEIKKFTKIEYRNENFIKEKKFPFEELPFSERDPLDPKGGR